MKDYLKFCTISTLSGMKYKHICVIFNSLYKGSNLLDFYPFNWSTHSFDTQVDLIDSWERAAIVHLF